MSSSELDDVLRQEHAASAQSGLVTVLRPPTPPPERQPWRPASPPRQEAPRQQAARGGPQLSKQEQLRLAMEEQTQMLAQAQAQQRGQAQIRTDAAEAALQEVERGDSLFRRRAPLWLLRRAPRPTSARVVRSAHEDLAGRARASYATAIEAASVARQGGPLATEKREPQSQPWTHDADGRPWLGDEHDVRGALGATPATRPAAARKQAQLEQQQQQQLARLDSKLERLQQRGEAERLQREISELERTVQRQLEELSHHRPPDRRTAERLELLRERHRLVSETYESELPQVQPAPRSSVGDAAPPPRSSAGDGIAQQWRALGRR